MNQAISELEKSLEDDMTSDIELGNIKEILYRLRSPNVTLFWHEYVVDQREIFMRVNIPLVCWKEAQTEFLVAPLLPDFRFTVPDDSTPKQYAEEAVQTWIRQQKEDKNLDEIKDMLEELISPGSLRVCNATLYLPDGLKCATAENQEDRMAQICADGRRELREVGKPHRFFSDSTPDFIQPDKIRQLEERLHSILTGQERRSIILLGPSFSGRNRMLQSMFLRIDRERNFDQIEGMFIQKDNPGPVPCWTLTPGGMVAGMSRTGQWEHRCHVIFTYASQKDIILRFKPFLGFLEAGHTGQSNLSIADVLRSELSRESFRAVAELTPEELRLLQEKDRMLVRQFEILEMPTLTQEEEYRIIAHACQQIRSESATDLSMLVLPTLLQLTAYFEPEKAMPGRVCRWLPKLDLCQNIAADSSDSYTNNRSLSSEHLSDCVLFDYERKTGHNTSFFYSAPDPSLTKEQKKTKRTLRERIVEKLHEGLVGQNEAVEILADTVLKIRMHLNDLSRTAGSFLFVGPTGIGKTEAAKQLTRVLYGSEENLVRFDANELITPWSVAALLGHGQQEGSLTSAVRQRPNCVLLFDEIEKGHPDLADLLLQVLGEGRLTDSLGRVVSFAQCVVIFTSNLGAQEAQHMIGFDANDDNQSASYDKAIRAFFRPEWLNRLDAIVPFKHLTRPELSQIATRMIDRVRTREGFRKRKVFLQVSPGVVELLSNQIRDARWGARSVIRLLEKKFVTPAAEFLAQAEIRNVSILEVENHDGKLGFHAEELHQAKGNELLNWLYELPENQALLEELSEAIIAFFDECTNRYSEVFPNQSDRETEEEKYRRFQFTEYCTQLTELVFESENESQHDSSANTRAKVRLGFFLKQHDGMSTQHDAWREDFFPEVRKTLTITEWDQILSAYYACTTSEIGAKLEEIKRRPQSFNLDAFFDLFAVFRPDQNKREGAVVTQITLPDTGDVPSFDIPVPDWIDSQELEQRRGISDNSHQWCSLTGRNACYWMSYLAGSELIYQGDSPTSVCLRTVISFDPDKESPEDVIHRWECDPNRAWGPVTRISWPGRIDCSRRVFPVEWIPKPIYDILKRYYDEATKTNPQEAANIQSKETNQ
ncbi:MAG: AAA family ATPase [Planctomycetia bacterium]|nr:AAA family ATPase [Planctomycetia bacterium]